MVKVKRYAAVLIALAAAVAAAAFSRTEDKSNAHGFENSETHVVEETLSLQMPNAEEPLAAVWFPYMAFECGSEQEFKDDFAAKLADASRIGANAIFVHVRPFADSFYPSAYEPWSHILTGIQGKDPGYDPLEYITDRAHALGFEFHAWINPLRISSAQTPNKLSEDSFYMSEHEKNPHYFLEHEGALYYNPAEPEIRERIALAAAEIVEKYDVDGIHLDDYFYPCENAEIDAASYEAYISRTESPLSLNEWRTANINALISEIYRRVKQADPLAEFGISPQGNIENDLAIHADVYTWCRQNGYVDYICPQLYYPMDGTRLSFGDALQEWLEIDKRDGIKLYIGLALYKLGTDLDSGAWSKDAEDIRRQIELCIRSGVDGISFYAVQNLDDEKMSEEIRAALDGFMS